jgi:hypothetical protein
MRQQSAFTAASGLPAGGEAFAAGGPPGLQTALAALQQQQAQQQAALQQSHAQQQQQQQQQQLSAAAALVAAHAAAQGGGMDSSSFLSQLPSLASPAPTPGSMHGGGGGMFGTPTVSRPSLYTPPFSRGGGGGGYSSGSGFATHGGGGGGGWAGGTPPASPDPGSMGYLHSPARPGMGGHGPQSLFNTPPRGEGGGTRHADARARVRGRARGACLHRGEAGLSSGYLSGRLLAPRGRRARARPRSASRARSARANVRPNTPRAPPLPAPRSATVRDAARHGHGSSRRRGVRHEEVRGPLVAEAGGTRRAPPRSAPLPRAGCLRGTALAPASLSVTVPSSSSSALCLASFTPLPPARCAASQPP